MKRNQFTKACVYAALITSMASCGGGSGGGDPQSTSVPSNSNPVSIASSTDATSVGSSYTISWTTGDFDSCTLSGAINDNVTGNGSVEISPWVDGEEETVISCDSQSESVTVYVLPEYISVPDEVLADALTRLGYPVADGKMKASDALSVERLCITSHVGFYGEADENGVAVFDNNSVPDGGVKCVYTSSGPYITDATGIESFLNLQTMRLEKQQVSEVDFSKLRKLFFLSLWRNPLINLDLSNNHSLTHLGVSETSLTSIDTSALINLEEAAFQSGQSVSELPSTFSNGTTTYGISEVDFSKNANIKRVYLHGNPLTDLGISNNKDTLQELWARDTLVEVLDLSGFTNLRYVIVSLSGELSYLNLYGINHGQVPFRLYCEGCPNLSEITVTNVQAYQEEIDSGSKIHIDNHISLIEGP